MKKIILSMFFVLAFSVNAKAADTKSFNIWANPAALGASVTNAGVDFKLGSSVTLGAALFAINFNASGLGALSTNLSATGYGAYLRYYFSNAIASSFRLSGFGYYMPLKYTQGAYSNTSNATWFGGLIGYHWVPGILNFGLDVGMLNFSGTSSTVVLTNSSGSTTTATGFTLTGTLPWIELTIGLAF
ncbi:MAG: hypothetical protein IPM57_01620 [Oligoflexia bacterium]|nr:hypothetical protein [Oligoflexia bacterium]